MASPLRPLASAPVTALVASLVSLSAFGTVAVAAEPAAAEPGAVASVPESESKSEADAGAIPGEAAAPAVPEPTPEAPAEPSEPGAEPVPSTVTSPATVPAVDPSLLDAKEPDDAGAAVRPVATQQAGRSPEEQLAVIEDAYALRYRPADNPVRLNVTGRVLFANMSGQERVNGRMGGASVDIGPSWNRVGIAGTFTGLAGRVLMPPHTGTELNGLLGGGLTVGFGRLALLSHGFLDLRVGYDVFYGVVNQASSGSAVLATQGEDGQLRAVPTESLMPHGPRARLDLGLVGAGNRRYFHGFGLTMGYQALLGSFRGDMPMTSVLTIGLSYWMG